MRNPLTKGQIGISLSFIVMLVALTAMSIVLTGCLDSYSETDEVAKTTWPLMTAEEKVIYNKVQDAWGQKSLRFLRERIRGREIKPDESMLPFIDMANVIKSTNNAFEYGSNDNDSSKRSKDKGRFNIVDEDWYRKLIKSIGEQYTQIHKPKETEFNEVSLENLVDIIEEVKRIGPENIINNLESGIIHREEELLSVDEYMDLEMSIGECEPAIKIIQDAANKNRPLTISDKSDIMYKISICETKKLADKF